MCHSVGSVAKIKGGLVGEMVAGNCYVAQSSGTLEVVLQRRDFNVRQAKHVVPNDPVA